MVVPKVCAGKNKFGEQTKTFCDWTTSACAEPAKVPTTPSSLIVTFDTEVRLSRNTLIKAFVFIAVLSSLVAVVLSADARIQSNAGPSQQEIEALREQVRRLTNQYDNLLQEVRSLKASVGKSDLDASGVSDSRYSFTNFRKELFSPQHTVAPSNAAVFGNEATAAGSTEESFMVDGDVHKKQVATDSGGAKRMLASYNEDAAFEENSVDGGSSQYGTLSLRRTKRTITRGKQSQRKASNAGRARQRRRGKFIGAAVAHFKGARPEAFFRDGGRLVAPWFLDDSESGPFSLSSSIEMKQGNGAVEVTESGLYYIYSQIYYLTSALINSYSLNLRHGNQTNSSVLSFCSASSVSETLNEVSCFTSVVRYLNATDRVFVQQRDMNRRIIMRDGYSYLGLVRLNV